MRANPTHREKYFKQALREFWEFSKTHTETYGEHARTMWVVSSDNPKRIDGIVGDYEESQWKALVSEAISNKSVDAVFVTSLKGPNILGLFAVLKEEQGWWKRFVWEIEVKQTENSTILENETFEEKLIDRKLFH